MRCDDVRSVVSAALDEHVDAGLRSTVDAHLATCTACTEFEAHLHALRQRLRLEPVGTVPDLTARVHEAIVTRTAEPHRRRPRTRLVPLAAAAVAAALVAGAVVRVAGAPTPPAAADLADRVVAAQRRIATLSANVTIVERGFADLVPERRFRGALAYRAPEQLHLELRDRTAYPSSSWRRNDVSVVIDDDSWWTRGPAPCPRDALPACTPPAPRTRVVVGREPFAPDTPAPLDLVVPVASFATSDDAPTLGRRRIDGRPSLGVRVTVAQLAPLLDGIRLAGSWRALHPDDVADVWLDEATFVPVAVRVRPSSDPDRAVWAATVGYRDAPSTAILQWRLTNIAIDGPLPGGSFASPPRVGAVDAGFVDADDDTPGAARPRWLPDGFRLHRRGTLATPGGPAVQVAAWSDGRAWVKVRTTTDWPGGRLFGSVGDAIRRTTVPGAGVVYVADGGRAVAVHGDDVDVVVTGSVATDDLLRIVSSLAVGGRPVPPDWAEASVTDLDAVRRLPGALVVHLPGFDGPAVRRHGDAVTLAYVGPGQRGFVLTESPAATLSPPFEPDVRAVTVRGSPGRFTPSLGELAWIENGLALELRSTSLALGDLLAIAARMRPAS
jgi:hypothetical protein